MTRITPLRLACACVLVAFAPAPPLVAQSPAGWSVSAAPADPALARLSEEQLVDLLQDAEPTLWTQPGPVDPFWAIGGMVNLGGGAITVPVRSPAAVELVRRGRQALPAVLNHLTDARPTKLVYVVPRPAAGRDSELAFDDEYDPRVRGTAPAGAVVNTGQRAPLNVEGTHTFKVGDLCYATLGQIVNRDLRPVRCRFEEGAIFSGYHSPNPGDWFLTINSPVLRPALAAAARADWSDVAAPQHAASLRDDIRRPVRKQPLDYGALTRLLYYFPGSGIEAAEALLRRTLTEPVAGAQETTDMGNERTVTFWAQSALVAALSPFDADRLRVALLDLYRQAAAKAAAARRTQSPCTWDPSVPSQGNDLALECARRLVGRGHDNEFRTFFSARLVAIETANKSADPAPGRDLGGARFVNRMQADEIRTFLAELGRAAPSPVARSAKIDSPAVAADPRVRLGPVSLTRSPRNVGVMIAPVEPAPGRVFVGRLVIDRARDDLGATLWPESVPSLAPVAVGRTSEDEMRALPQAALAATLTRASPQAKALARLEGRIELVVPDLDPDAMVVVFDITAKLGTALASAALRAANISLTIHDRQTAGAVEAAMRGGSPLAEEARRTNPRFRAPGYEAGDVALAITDPDGRFLNVEFRDVAGQALRYNHNGWSHSSNRDTRLDVYRLGDRIPPGTQMVVWLRTEKAFLVVPLEAVDLPLPAETEAGR